MIKSWRYLILTKSMINKNTIDKGSLKNIQLINEYDSSNYTKGVFLRDQFWKNNIFADC